jgi:hypothetical protein
VTAAIGAAALATIAAAILAGALVLLRTRSLRQALPVLLDLLTAAGLLRLAAAPTWSALAVTAIVIVLRRLVTAGIRTASAARRP